MNKSLKRLVNGSRVRVMMFNVSQQHLSYIVVASFIGGGNWNTWKKPLTCCRSQTNFIT